MTIEKLNELFRLDLGTTPLHAWKNTDDLWLMIHKIDEAGVPQWTAKQKNAAGLYAPQPIYVRHPLMPAFHDQWVMCYRSTVCEPQLFRQHFGSAIIYPHEGIWRPIQPTMCKPGMLPDELTTRKMIEAVKEHRATIKELLRKDDERAENVELKDEQRLRDVIRDVLPAFGEIPGKKGLTSFYTPDSQRTNNPQPKETIQ